MKKLLMIIGLVAGLTVATALAQMGGGQGTGGMMGGTHSEQMAGQNMMNNMATIMDQMNGMMQNLSHPMRHLTVTEHAKMHDMGVIMREMAAQMNDMATQMEQGKMDQTTVKQMQEKMRLTNQKIDALQKEGK